MLCYVNFTRLFHIEIHIFRFHIEENILLAHSCICMLYYDICCIICECERREKSGREKRVGGD